MAWLIACYTRCRRASCQLCWLRGRHPCLIFFFLVFIVFVFVLFILKQLKLLFIYKRYNFYICGDAEEGQRRAGTT